MLVMQAPCLAAEVPSAMRELQSAADANDLVDVNAARYQDMPVCSRGTPMPYGDRKLITQHDVFRVQELSIWRRVYIGETVDGIIVAICSLMATVAIGTTIMRLVRLRKGRSLTRHALQREVAYQTVFVPAVTRLWHAFKRRCCRCCHYAQQPSQAPERAHKHIERPHWRLVLLVALPAAILWLVCEVQRCNCYAHFCE